MAVARGQTIAQADMDALAALANTKLLPKINAVIAEGVAVGGGNYSYFAGANYYNKIKGGVNDGGTLVSPQPNYSFTIPALANLIPSGATYDGSGQYEITIATAGDYDLLVKDDIGFSINDSTTVDFYIDARSYYLSVGATVYVLGNSGAPVTAIITPAQGWLSEFNRIRTDTMALLLGTPGVFYVDGYNVGETFAYPADTSGLFCNPNAAISGPWCVGVNDLTTYPSVDGSAFLDCTGQFFNSLEFWYQGAVAPSVKSQFQIGAASAVVRNQLNATSTGANTSSLSFVVQSGFACTMVLHLSVPIHSTAYIAAYSCASTGATITSQTPPNGTVNPNDFTLELVLMIAVAAGNNSVTLNFDGSPVISYTTSPTLYTDLIEVDESPAPTAVNALTPNGGANKISILGGAGAWIQIIGTDSYGGDSFAANCVSSSKIILSDPTISGVWVAKTLPVGGQNVYLDADLPPYVNYLTGSWHDNSFDNSNLSFAPNTAVFLNSGQSGLADDPQTTSVRAIAPQPIYDLNASEWTDVVGVIKGVLPALQPQPSQWPVLRDTDVVPFDYGFNQFNSHETVTKVSGPFWGSVSVPPNATAVRLRIVQSGTGPGWYGGVFKYGLPLGEIVPIYIAASYAPTPTVYDATTNTNSFDADGDFSLSVITANEGFSYYLNPADGVVYDVYIEVDFAPPQRNFFAPFSAECFSFMLNDTPALSQLITHAGGNAYTFPKPVPQSGYSIFKVRATRPAVAGAGGIYAIPATGAEIVVTLGQNVITNGPPNPFQPPFGMGGGMGMGNGGGYGMGGQIGQQTLTFVPFTNPDGSPLTITIPATGSTTGDVSVFIPCIAGNELVWQSASDVRLEAWVNWQPIWFNNVYQSGEYPLNPVNYPVDTSVPVNCRYALNFINSFDKSIFGWPSIGNGVVQLPWSAEIYNDLITVLNLIP